MSDLVIQARARASTPVTHVAAALGQPGGLDWIQSPWTLPEDAAATVGARLEWRLGAHSLTAEVLQADERGVHFRTPDGRLEGRLELSPLDGGSEVTFEGHFPILGGVGERVFAATHLAEMQALTSEETQAGLQRLVETGAPQRAAPTTPQTLNPAAAWERRLQQLPAVMAVPRKPPTATELFELDSEGRPSPAPDEIPIVLYAIEDYGRGPSTITWFVNGDGSPASPGYHDALVMRFGGGAGYLLVTDRRLLGTTSGDSLFAGRAKTWPDNSTLHFAAPLESVVATSACRAKKMFGASTTEREFALRLEHDGKRGALNVKLKRHLSGGPFAPGAKPDGLVALQHLVQAVAARHLDLGSYPERKAALEALAGGQLETTRNMFPERLLADFSGQGLS